MTEAGQRLIAAANEALAIAKGEADPATYVVHAPPAVIDVKAIRKGVNMTQQAFGERFGFGKARIRDWEQGRTRPAASDRVLLVTIKASPDIVLSALREASTTPSLSPEKAKARRMAKRLGKHLAMGGVAVEESPEKRPKASTRKAKKVA